MADEPGGFNEQVKFLLLIGTAIASGAASFAAAKTRFETEIEAIKTGELVSIKDRQDRFRNDIKALEARVLDSIEERADLKARADAQEKRVDRTVDILIEQIRQE